MKAIEAMVEDLVNHDMEKLHAIIDKRMDMLDCFTEKSMYIITLCRELWLMSFEIDIGTMEAATGKSRRQVGEALIGDINTLLARYFVHTLKGK